MELKQKAIGSTLWTTLEGSVRELLSFAVFLLLARMLSPEAYGLIAIATVVIAVTSTLSELGFQQAIIQTAELVPQRLYSAFWLSIALSGLLYFSIWMTGPILSAAFGEPELSSIIRWLGLIVVLKSLTVVHRGLLVRNFQFRLLAMRSITSIAVGGAVGVGMALQGYTVWALVGQQLAAAATSTLTLWLSVAWKPAFKFSWPDLKTMLPFSLSITGSNLVDVANRQSDKLIIGACLGTTELGAYSIAYKVFAAANSVILGSLSKIALPSFSQLQTDLLKLRNAYYTAVGVSSAVSLPIFLLIMLSVDRLIPVLFGVQWAASIPILQLLMVSSCVHSINSFSSPLLLALGKARTVFRLNIINASLSLLGLIIAVQWGVLAVAFAFVLRSAVMLPVDFYFLHRYANISYKHLMSRLKAQIAGMLAIVLIFVACNRYLSNLDDWTVLSIQYLASAIAYYWVLFILDRRLCTRISEFLLIATKRG